jgi:serine/threonine protein kinase
MAIQPSSGSILQILAASGLLRSEQMAIVRKRFSSSDENVPTDVSAQEIMTWLLNRKLITPWHAEKLIQGRFRGFFLGGYKLLNRVARGGMSTIYAAEDIQSGEIHALKVLPQSKNEKTSYLMRLEREATIMHRLHHPNIVRVFGIFSGTDGQVDVHFMAMELLQGRDLFEIVNADGPMPCRKAVEFIRQAALGLEHAHKAGLVPRDIKPGNLFLSDDQTVRILDLGLAQDFDSEENLTRDFNERVLGTADYLAPEQAADSHNVDIRADIYSLGCSLYFMLTGQPPFTEGTLVQRLIAHQTKTPPAITEFRSDVPEELTQILLKMMARNRNDRTATAGDVAAQLSSFLMTTVSRPELDAIPMILQRAAPVQSPARVVEPDFDVPVGSGILLAPETATNAGGDSSLLKTTVLRPGTMKARTSKGTTKDWVLYWVIGGICLLAAAAIGFALM